ncbi:MAG: DUF3857 and transglutaminase domain-containing protein [Acidobacteria bacterium]|nr:DUF3857 and transglutaminase domain-containing protein [Acidobacteriota bacterium]
MRRCWLLLVFICATWLLAAPDVAELSRKADVYRGKFDHVILLDDADVRVHDSGLGHRHETVAVKVMSERGCRDFHTVSLFYDPLTQVVKVVAAEVLQADGGRRQISLADVKTYPQPARAIYWPNIRISIPFGLLEVGDVLRYELEKKGFSYALLADDMDDSRFVPPMAGHFYDIVHFQDFIPIMSKRYAVELPKDKPLQYRFYHGEVAPFLEFTDFGMRYVFEKNDIEPVTREPHMVDISDVCQKLLLSTTARWEDKSEWFYGVNENFSFEVIPAVQEKVDELIRPCRTDEEKIDVLNHWVAHYIRYSGLSMGQGEGYTLHPSDMIFRDRSGVCKDKASLLVTFLRAAGFDAYPAMTMAGARIEDFPADHFNHSVVALRQKDGTFRLLDPTWVPWVREQWSSAEQEQQYLIGYKEGQPLMTTPYSPPERHYYDLHVRGAIDTGGTLTGRITLECEGQTDSRLRRLIRRDHPMQTEAYFIHTVTQDFPAAEITNLQYQDPGDISQPMKVSFDVRIPGFALKSLSGLAFRSPALIYAGNDAINQELEWTIPDDETERRHGIRTRCTKLYRITEEITLPGGAEPVVLMNGRDHQGEFANVECASTLEDNVVRNSLTLAFNKRVFPPEAWPDLREVIRIFQTAENDFIKVNF